MKPLTGLLAAAAALAAAAGPAPAGVVINEIAYNPPDDRDDLQFVELHNPGPGPADLGGWKLKGARYQFPAGTTLPAGGYLVVARDPAAVKQHYGVDAIGPFAGALGDGGEKLELADAGGKKVDAVRYRTRAPWPVAPDGHGPTLERICPTAPGDGPENWASSPFPSGPPRPAGTPGRPNAGFAPRLPPAITDVAVTPARPAPGQELTVEAAVRSADGVQTVELRYRAAGPGTETEDVAVPMAKGANGRYAGRIPAHKAGQIVRVRVRAVDGKGGERVFPGENELRPAVSVYVHDGAKPDKVPLGYVIHVGRDEFRAAQRPPGRGYWAPAAPDPPARGRSAFVHVGTKTGEPELFDFVSIPARSGGRKVHFHKDRPLDGMTTVNLIYEYFDRFALAEPLAYEVYRKAGAAAPRTDFVRTWVDGRPAGFQLLIEQPNKAFLKRNKLDPDGHLYKAVWFGNGVVGQHEKKTRVRDGHAGLVKLVGDLTRTSGDEQWAVIKKNFDPQKAATHYAVRTLLSDWDGFFNNYFLYHDSRGTGKWFFFPWDQDKTWGFHDGSNGSVFVDMPVTFGMTGDVPPGWPKGRPAPQGFGFGSAWWRPPGHLSGPLLANPTFRRLYLARTKELLETVYTEEAFFPVIKETGARLEGEVKFRAGLYRQDPARALEGHARTLDSLREHLTKRRKFLLDQEEIKAAKPPDPKELK